MCVCVIYQQTDDDGVEVGFFFVDKVLPSFFNKRRGQSLASNSTSQFGAGGLRNSEPLGLLASVWRLMPFDACQTRDDSLTRTSQILFFFSHKSSVLHDVYLHNLSFFFFSHLILQNS